MRRFVTVLQGDVRAGDRWLVQSVDPETGATVFVRQEAEPGQFRRRGDGRWPPLPDPTPVSDEEARVLADELDAALVREGERLRAEAWRAHDALMAEALKGEP